MSIDVRAVRDVVPIPLQETQIPVIIKPGAFGDAGCLVRSLERLRAINHGSPA